jgi:hypothetical protein
VSPTSLNFRAAALALLLPLGFAATTPALAEFGAPVTVSPPEDLRTYGPRLAMNAAGRALIVWVSANQAQQNPRIHARLLEPGGSLLPVETVSGLEISFHDPRVAMGADGAALVVWQRNGRVEARARSPAGVWGPVETLSEAGEQVRALSHQVAMGAGSDALVVWERFDGTTGRTKALRARARSAAGLFGPIERISPRDELASQPQVATDADGNALVAWKGSNGTDSLIQARARSAAGVWGRTKTLSEPGQDARSPQVAIDGDGNAVIFWSRSDGMNTRVQARARSATGIWGVVEALSEAGQSAALERVAMNADGTALIVWSSGGQIQARTRSTAGVLGPVQTLSTARPGAAFNPQVAIDASGNAVIVWQIEGPTSRPWLYRLQARALSAAGELGPVQTLTEVGEQPAQDPHVAMSADGAALVIWARHYKGILAAADE